MTTTNPRAAHTPPSATPVDAIDVHDIRKTFGSTRALDGVDLQVPVGQIVALLGKNGAGKTTLIDIILGLQHSDSGTATLFGMTPREAVRHSLVGVVQQTGALLPDYTVIQTLRVFGGAHAHPLPYDRVLAETDLTHLARRKVGKLSGGERQRVRLALALLPDPLLLILDEPTAGMDAVARLRFWELMRAQAQAGRTVVFATHYLAEAQDFAERTIIVTRGHISIDASTDEVRHLDTTRTLRMTADDSADLAGAIDSLRTLPGSQDWLIETPPALVTIQGSSLDDAARLLLSTPGLHGLEIVASSLEDVFTSLSEGTDAVSSTPTTHEPPSFATQENQS